MSLRARLTLAAAAAVAIAVVLVAVVSYFIVERRLVDQVDRGLADQSQQLTGCPFISDVLTGGRAAPVIPETRMVQILFADGDTYAPPFQNGRLPINAGDRNTINQTGVLHFRNVVVNGEHLRMVTRNSGCAGPGLAIVQLAAPLHDVDTTMASLRWILGVVAGAGILVAAGLGLLVARSALRPVAKLTEAAEHVAETQNLAASIDVTSHDEIGRLATSFNEMLAALAASRSQQRQLVADASHELRTPLTSLRTNIEVLESQPDMPVAQREQLLGDVVTQLEELSVLVGDLVELAREDGMPQPEALVEVRLDRLVEHAVERARLHAPRLHFEIKESQPTVLDAQRGLLERAVTNILDNAAKWSPPGGSIEIVLHVGTLTVRDHGPGIDPADLPHVFDRFYRSSAARSMPGSGLGLAIVRHAAEAHGGSVRAEPAQGGGTVIRMELPSAEPVSAITASAPDGTSTGG
jgi:two-component system sensor histidine kinase MprB